MTLLRLQGPCWNTSVIHRGQPSPESTPYPAHPELLCTACAADRKPPAVSSPLMREILPLKLQSSGLIIYYYSNNSNDAQIITLRGTLRFTKHSHYSEPHSLSVRCLKLVFLSVLHISRERANDLSKVFRQESWVFWPPVPQTFCSALHCALWMLLQSSGTVRSGGAGPGDPVQGEPLPSSSSAPD